MSAARENKACRLQRQEGVETSISLLRAQALTSLDRDLPHSRQKVDVVYSLSRGYGVSIFQYIRARLLRELKISYDPSTYTNPCILTLFELLLGLL